MYERGRWKNKGKVRKNNIENCFFIEHHRFIIDFHWFVIDFHWFVIDFQWFFIDFPPK